MTLIQLQRESDQTVSRFVTPTVQLIDDRQVVAGAVQPLIVRDDSIQCVIDGRTFYVFKMYRTVAPLAAGASIDIVITSAVGKNLGIGYIAECGGNAELTVSENVTNIVGGTIFVPFNRNRGSALTSTTGALINPTSLTLGTTVYEELVLGGSGGNAAGASVRGDYALLDDVSYLFRLTNVTGQAHIASLAIQWVE
jgi:hypothetical protein